MLTTLYYLLRSRKDGSYLAAHSQGRTENEQPKEAPDPGYLILFQEYADGLSYLNAHAPDRAADFAVESVSQTQLKGVMQRWRFKGVGLVTDPLLPKVEFMQRQG
ncbi:MAG: hypothetical protein F6K30_21905 [Cyanothece sp. SIO2G6]|nr:hypothetical protein [Cyanothece sp. SIO2G6]